MDLEIFSPFTVLVSLFFIFILFLLLLISKQRNNNNLPPGPWKFPFIGHLHLLSSRSEPLHRILNNLSKKYGPLMHLQLGEIPTLVVSSPEIVKHFLKTHDITFASRPSFLAIEVMSNGGRDMAFAPYGEYWRQLRKIFTLELLSMKRVHSFQPIRKNEFTNLCRWIASQEGSVINLTENVISTNFDVMMLAALGKKTGEQAKYRSVAKEMAVASSGLSIADVFPSLKFFDTVTGYRKKIEGLYRETEAIMLKIIDDHKLTKNDLNGEKQEDLLDVLLKDGLELPLSIKEIIPILQDVFSAGVETSAITTNWAMAELLKNPIALQKAQDEVRHVFDKKTRLDESFFDELKYLKLVIKETLRMHPPLPLLLPRECRKQCMINGYNVLPKTRVLVNAWTINRDPEYWKDPDKFEPERFVLDDLDYKGNSLHYIPFGAGRRICPGVSFGLANLELPLAMFLYHFNWSLPGGMKPEEVDMMEAFGNTASKKTDLYVIPVVMRPLPAE